MKNTTDKIEETPSEQVKPTLSSLYAELSKIRLSLLVVVTTGAGFIMASPLGIDWLMLLWTLLGTTACAGSAAALQPIN